MEGARTAALAHLHSGATVCRTSHATSGFVSGLEQRQRQQQQFFTSHSELLTLTVRDKKFLSTQLVSMAIITISFVPEASAPGRCIDPTYMSASFFLGNAFGLVALKVQCVE